MSVVEDQRTGLNAPDPEDAGNIAPPAKPPLWRRRAWRPPLALGLLLLTAAAPQDAVRGGDPIELTARPYVFDVVSWEAQQVALHAPGLIGALIPPNQSDRNAEDQAVIDYFVLTRQWRDADVAAQRLHDTGSPEQAQAATQKAAGLEVQRSAAERTVAPIIARHISQELLAEGLKLDAGPVMTPFPPVSFEMTRPPSVLVVAPRDRITLLRSIVLRPGLTDPEIVRIEAALERSGFSVIVEPTGGFPTYPAMVPETGSLEFTLSAITHEWLHAYFFMGPLGQRYADSGEMRTINETSADLGGNEIGARLALRYLRLLPPPPSAPAPAAPAAAPNPATPQPPPFDFTKEMRATRVQAEALLKDGKVEEAERYMEERRLMFVRQGYLLRKLNQAYFAFHGSYADGPGSVSPVAGYLRGVRERAGSMGAFVQQVRGVGSYADLLALVRAAGGETPTPTGRQDGR
ncbi:MAG: hypothetical protein NTZ05_21795 [Chloroflexi bacterium]|nr:hypothetical protein [Chloroflexota bacterium]